MAIRGSLSEASLADVLQLLALGQKTGVLSIARERELANVHFVRGAVVHAERVTQRQRLGDRLVRAGALEADALTRVVAERRPADDRALAVQLRREGLVADDVLAREIRPLTEAVVYEVFAWPTGTFAFEPLPEPSTADDAPLVELPADALLMEAARRVDEWTQIAVKIPSLDLIFEIDESRLRDAGVSLSAVESRVVPFLDGSRDVAAVAERVGLATFDVGKAIYGLITGGFAQRVGRSAAHRPPAPESRLAEHRTLGLAFYKTGMLDDAAREFGRVLELRHDDGPARFHLALVELRRGRTDVALDALRLAAALPDATGAVHLALAYACEHAGEFDEAEQALAEASRRGLGEDPRLPLAQAFLALRRADLARAEERLGTARALWGARQPSAIWFHAAGLTAGLGGDYPRAVQLLEDGVAVHPHVAMLHNDLAVAQERAGLDEAAARTLEHALLEDTALPHLHKNLGDYHYRAQRYDEAFEAYTRVTRLAPAHGADTWLKLGNIHLRRGDRARAREAWEQALALDPDNRIARGNIAALADAATAGDRVAA